MDSLTQIVLGAAVGEATLGKKIGRKASLYGAALGTLPDLDVLWVKNAVDSFTEHRSFSHSLLVLLLVSPLIAWLLKRWHPFDKNKPIITEEQNLSQPDSNQQKLNQTELIPISFTYYFISVYAVLATHALLDWFTVYGTQLLWPITTYPFGLGSIFIVDPLYTLSFLLCLVITIIWRQHKVLFLGIILSCSYLAWSLVAQATQADYFKEGLQKKGISIDRSLTLPMPLNTLLWKNITVVDDGYWVSFRSVFDSKNASLQTHFFPSEIEKLSLVADTESVQKLQFFTKGFYQVRELDNGIWLSDLRMGGFGHFVFNFRVAERKKGDIVKPNIVTSVTHRGNKELLSSVMNRIWQRIFDEKVELFDLFETAQMVQYEK